MEKSSSMTLLSFGFIAMLLFNFSGVKSEVCEEIKEYEPVCINGNCFDYCGEAHLKGFGMCSKSNDTQCICIWPC